MDRLFDILPKLRRIREEKRQAKLAEQRRKERAGRILDLVAQFHQVDNVKLPFPNLMVKSLLEKHLGNWDNIDLNNDYHLATTVFLMENSKNKDLASWPKDKLDSIFLKR